ncbi:MAG: xanthine dehydrogenase family protein molybdopterin-binding subunit [Gemmatimonadetes bacterium]|nr:xanthine dehydrogenase family protein molybdopterin-binding subunit [Gemmatimonadota bacterium]
MTPEAASAAGIQLNAFVSIDTAGKVTLVTHRAEMGQGAYSVVPQILAEELEVDLAAIAIVVAEGDPAKYGSQLTGGSSTVRGGITQLLKTGATARDMLVRAAAARWGVPADSCQARMGQVTHAASGRTLGYGALVEDAAKLTPNKDVALKERKDWTLIGKPVPRQDTPLKVNGSAKFGIDVRLPGMLYAVVERSPRFVGKVKSFDASKALLVPGVKHVVRTERDIFGNMREGVAVVATSTWAAIKGRRALIVEWDDTGIPEVSSASLAAALKSSLAGKPLGFKSKETWRRR